jgi:hypothetical protein
MQSIRESIKEAAGESVKGFSFDEQGQATITP